MTTRQDIARDLIAFRKTERCLRNGLTYWKLIPGPIGEQALRDSFQRQKDYRLAYAYDSHCQFVTIVSVNVTICVTDPSANPLKINDLHVGTPIAL